MRDVYNHNTGKSAAYVESGKCQGISQCLENGHRVTGSVVLYVLC